VSVEPHVARLRACKRRTDHAPRVLQLWIEGSEHSRGVPGRSLVTTDDKRFCHDCRERRTLYLWKCWPMICAWCSLARFENGGENPRKATTAERTGGR